MRRRILALALVLTAASGFPASAQSSPPTEGRFFGYGLAIADYWTAYYTDNGATTYYPYISWTQVQAVGFLETRGPFAVAGKQTRLRLELRLGSGGAIDDGTSSGPKVTTDGGASVGAGATLRLPLADAAKRTQLYVGAGLDLTMLIGFGDDGSSYFSEGWAETLLTAPVLVGLRMTRGSFVIRPELRYSLFGSSSTTLEPPSSAVLDENVMPGSMALVVTLSRR